jgi:hypothetical protein
MPIDATTLSQLEAVRGGAWRRYQAARLEQRHLQCGRHFRLDVGSILSRIAVATLAVRPMEVAASRARTSGDFMRRALVGAIDHCARMEAAAFQRPV